MFSVSLQNTTYTVEKNKEQLVINQDLINWDLQWVDENRIHLVKNGKSFEAELISLDHQTKSLKIRLGHQTAEIQIKDRFDILLEKMGFAGSGGSHLKEVKAPMPGLILDLKVKPGDQVKKGDVLLILEAMKMENIIKAPGDAEVKDVKVSLKQSVEKNQVLIQF